METPWHCRPDLTCEPEDGPGSGDEPPDDDPGPGNIPGGWLGPRDILVEIAPPDGGPLDVVTLINEEFSQTGDGRCLQLMRLSGPSDISVGDRHLGVGDQVVVIERPQSRQGRYVYADFQAMEVTSSAAEIVLTNETSR